MTPIRHILHPTDFSEMSAHAWSVAASLARDYGARLTVVHVIPPPPVMIAGEMPIIPMDPKENVRNLTSELAALQTGYKEVVVDRKLVEGDPATEIVALAESLDADLIVMGTHGRTGLGRLLMGSVAEQVSRKASAPVLLIKNPKLVGLAAAETRDAQKKAPQAVLAK